MYSIEDPFFFLNHLLTADKKAPDVLETVSWAITDKRWECRRKFLVLMVLMADLS